MIVISEFEQAYNLVQKTSGQEFDITTVKLLEDTVQLYQGPLLEGWYQGLVLTGARTSPKHVSWDTRLEGTIRKSTPHE